MTIDARIRGLEGIISNKVDGAERVGCAGVRVVDEWTIDSRKRRWATVFT